MLRVLDIIANKVMEIQRTADETADGNVCAEKEATDDSNTSNVPLASTLMEVENFYDSGLSTEAYVHSKELLRREDIDHVCRAALGVVELLQLGKLEKGAASTSSKYKSRNERWFNQKVASGSTEAGNENDNEVEVYIERDGLVQMNCKCGKTVLVEKYGVLA